MHYRRFLRTLFIGLPLFLVVSGFSPPVNACLDVAQPIDVTVTHLPDINKAIVLATGYDLFGITVPPDRFCVCGFAFGDPNSPTTCIASVDAVDVMNTNTGKILGCFNFAANGTTSSSSSSVQSAPNWQGFFTQVSTNLTANDPIDLRWRVSLIPGCLSANLTNEVAASLFGTDEGDSSGNTTGGHLNIISPNTVTLGTVPPIPTLSPRGILLLVLLLLSVMTIILVRRHLVIHRK